LSTIQENVPGFSFLTVISKSSYFKG